jgi:hypothetical protein
MKQIYRLTYTNREGLNTVVINPIENGVQTETQLMFVSEQPQSTIDLIEQIRINCAELLATKYDNSDVLYVSYKDFSEEYGSEKNSICVENTTNETYITGDLRYFAIWNPAKKMKFDEFAQVVTQFINK